MSNHEPIELAGIRNITISGRIGAGATTLAKKLSGVLNWPLLEGGDLFEKIHKQLNISQVDVLQRPDSFDLQFEVQIKKILTEEKQQIIQSHLAGFDIQGLAGVYKILVICQDPQGEDKADIRIDRLMNRDGISLQEAKHEALVREEENLEKFRKLYAHNDQSWIYWNPKYYDLIVNTYSLNREEALEFVLEKIGFAKL
ncbi:MAG TPA: cytidylate kinase family protein [Patescibacteria group bacterium]|jgi:cytidylate kinase|nr:cytidylate kinase family protein [Patescibacteria group bacterium]